MCINVWNMEFANDVFFDQLRLRTEVLRTSSSTRPGFKLMTSRSWQHITYHWDACSNHLVISDLQQRCFLKYVTTIVGEWMCENDIVKITLHVQSCILQMATGNGYQWHFRVMNHNGLYIGLGYMWRNGVCPWYLWCYIEDKHWEE